MIVAQTSESMKEVGNRDCWCRVASLARVIGCLAHGRIGLFVPSRAQQQHLGCFPVASSISTLSDADRTHAHARTHKHTHACTHARTRARAHTHTHTGALTNIAFSPSADLVAAGGLRGTLGVWDIRKGRSVEGRPHPVLLGGNASVSSLAFTPDSRALLVAGTDGILWAWDVRAGRFLGQLQPLAHAPDMSQKIET
jgi:WD40 repeat protein